jgi:SIT4-associating protein SAP185/190
VRLAAQKQQVAENADAEGEERKEEDEENRDSSWHTRNPFVVAGVDDDAEGGSMFPNTDFASRETDQTFSPTFPEPGFSPPDSLSTGSSEDDADGHAEAVRRRVRVPLEVEDDDDEMGEMVAPSGTGLVDSDDEEETIINESLGYSNLTGPARYSNFGRSRAVGSHFEDDDDEQNDSSDGEDDGLVEIMVPGRKSSTSH